MPKKNDKYTLRHITVITRHGHRSPINPLLPINTRGRWDCDDTEAMASRMEAAPSKYYRYYQQNLAVDAIEYPPSCRAGDLTTLGMKMHYDLGAQYRKYLVDDLGFLPSNMKPNMFEFYSSPVERSFRSAESFISGLYPPKSDNEVLTITTGATESNPLDPQMCKEFADAKAEYMKSEQYAQFIEEIWPKLEDAASYLGLEKSVENAHLICGWAVAFNCSVGSNAPAFINDEFMNACRRDTWMTQYGLFNYTADHAVLASPVLREALRIINNALKSNDKKFALLSAHDTTLGAILTLFGVFKDVVPQYASHLAMEILLDKENNNEKYVRFTYNGEELSIPLFDNQSIIKFDDFCKKLEPLIQHCQDIPVY